MFLDMRLLLLHCQSGTIVEDIALHLLDLLSDLFAISEKEKMRHIYFVKLTRTAKFPHWEIIIFFRELFLALKRAANVRVISPNGLHIPRPTIGRGEAFGKV